MRVRWDLLGFNNGVYNIKKLEFKDKKATDYISKNFGFDLNVKSN